MPQANDNPRFKEILTPEELKQRIDFEAELKVNLIREVEFEKSWFETVDSIQENFKHHMPESELGIDIAKKFMFATNKLYGKKYASLRTKEFEEGLCKGKYLDGTGITLEQVLWLSKAIDAYRRQCVHSVLNRVGQEPSDITLQLWQETLEDMYGYNDFAHKKAIYEAALKDEAISTQAKNWLRTIYKSDTISYQNQKNV